MVHSPLWFPFYAVSPPSSLSSPLLTACLQLLLKPATPMPCLHKSDHRDPSHGISTNGIIVLRLLAHSRNRRSLEDGRKLLPCEANFSGRQPEPTCSIKKRSFGNFPIGCFHRLKESPPFNCRYSRNLFRKVRILIPKVLAACVRLPSCRSNVFKMSSRSISQMVPLGPLA